METLAFITSTNDWVMEISKYNGKFDDFPKFSFETAQTKRGMHHLYNLNY